MFGFLGLILIFILLIILIGFTLIANLLRTLFGLGKRAPKPYDNQSANDASTANNSSTTTSKKKIFDDDEGEYVEFEEVE